MKKSVFAVSLLTAFIMLAMPTYANELTINDKDYFEMQGLDVTVFSDIYPTRVKIAKVLTRLSIPI